MKILKYECPKPLHDSFSMSSSNNRNLIILPPHKNNQFSNKSAVLWNKLLRPYKIPSLYEIDVNVSKYTLKNYLLKQQNFGDGPNWINANNCL